MTRISLHKMTVLVLVAQTQPLFAQELVWTNVRAYGGGDGPRCLYSEADPAQNNVFFTSAGAEASVVFQNFGINLKPERALFGRVLSRSASCNVEADIIIPQGYYLATLTQTLGVAIWKDKRTVGGLSANAFLFENKIPLNQINIPLGPNVVRPLQAAASVYTNQQIFQPAQVALQCAVTAFQPVTTKFKLQLLATGNRILPVQAFVLNVEGNDVHFHYDFQPSLKPCTP